MTNYRRTIFSYRFLENSPENYDTLVGYGITPEGMMEGFGVLINIELDRVEGGMSIDNFARDFEPIIE